MRDTGVIKGKRCKNIRVEIEKRELETGDVKQREMYDIEIAGGEIER